MIQTSTNVHTWGDIWKISTVCDLKEMLLMILRNAGKLIVTHRYDKHVELGNSLNTQILEPNFSGSGSSSGTFFLAL